MSEHKEGSVQFTPGDFRAWNQAGFKEVSAALAEARKRFSEAETLREKELAQVRLDSLEQLCRMALQVARERFEVARADAAGRLRVAVEKLQTTPLPVATADWLWQKVSSATQAYAEKRFDQTVRELAVVEAALVHKPQREAASMPVKAAAEPVTTSATQRQVPGANSLLDLAAQHEKNGRRGIACRLYLKALVQTASTIADHR